MSALQPKADISYGAAGGARAGGETANLSRQRSQLVGRFVDSIDARLTEQAISIG